MSGPKNEPLPRYILDLLSAVPRRGQGLHQWLFRVARALHKYRTQQEIIELLRASTAGEPVKAAEIEDAVVNSAAPECQQPCYSERRVAWPSLNVGKRNEIIAGGIGLAQLRTLSPRSLDEGEIHTDEIIDSLFPGDQWLCCGFSEKKAYTRLRSEWRGKLSEMQLIVPSPMLGKFGATKDGKKSQRSLQNTGPRRFLVIEQDAGTPDEQTAVLMHLAQRAPLVLAVHSGNKSIHGWFYCEGVPEARLRSFMNYAVSLGADRATWTPAQFVRMPAGNRANGNRQSVYFFNPEVLK
jgi:hypothetical protein